MSLRICRTGERHGPAEGRDHLDRPRKTLSDCLLGRPCPRRLPPCSPNDASPTADVSINHRVIKASVITTRKSRASPDRPCGSQSVELSIISVCVCGRNPSSLPANLANRRPRRCGLDDAPGEGGAMMIVAPYPPLVTPSIGVSTA